MAQTAYMLAQRQRKVAIDRYNANFNNESYRAATRGKSISYADALTDEALALSGSPDCRLSYRKWSPAATLHLERFV